MAYRVHGPYEPEHRPTAFNSQQAVAADALCQAACRTAGMGAMAHFGYRTGSAREDLSFDRRDNARGHATKARGGR